MRKRRRGAGPTGRPWVTEKEGGESFWKKRRSRRLVGLLDGGVRGKSRKTGLIKRTGKERGVSMEKKSPGELEEIGQKGKTGKDNPTTGVRGLISEGTPRTVSSSREGNITVVLTGGGIGVVERKHLGRIENSSNLGAVSGANILSNSSEGRTSKEEEETGRFWREEAGCTR